MASANNPHTIKTQDQKVAEINQILQQRDLRAFNEYFHGLTNKELNSDSIINILNAASRDLRKDVLETIFLYQPQENLVNQINNLIKRGELYRFSDANHILKILIEYPNFAPRKENEIRDEEVNTRGIIEQINEPNKGVLSKLYDKYLEKAASENAKEASAADDFGGEEQGEVASRDERKAAMSRRINERALEEFKRKRRRETTAAADFEENLGRGDEEDLDEEQQSSPPKRARAADGSGVAKNSDGQAYAASPEQDDSSQGASSFAGIRLPQHNAGQGAERLRRVGAIKGRGGRFGAVGGTLRRGAKRGEEKGASASKLDDEGNETFI